MKITREQYQDEVKKYWSERCNRLQAELTKTNGLIRMALNELGVPGKDCPAPIANAVEFLNETLKGK